MLRSLRLHLCKVGDERSFSFTPVGRVAVGQIVSCEDLVLAQLEGLKGEAPPAGGRHCRPTGTVQMALRERAKM